MRKKIVIAVLLLSAALTIALAVIRTPTAGTRSPAAAAPDEVRAAETRQSDPPLSKDENTKPFNQKQEEELESIFEKTYIYYDEFLEGKPITYTFYEDGTMVAYYWEDTETESIPLSSQWAQYSVNEDVTEITLDWDDGIKTTEPFEITTKAIKIGESEFRISDREIHLN